LAFAVAINVSPDLLVVDEALAVGDEAFQRKCLARIDTIRDSGATVLFVSHSAGTVVELCDRAVLLDQGELLMEGTPKAVVASYQKLLYAPRERTSLIREQIRSSHKGKGIRPPSPSSDAPGNSESGVLAVDNESAGFEEDDPAYWEEGMVSTSTVEYERQGACIDDPHLETLDGRRVNVLSPGRTYVYRYKVRLERALAGVRCGMMIRSLTGIEVGGAASMLPQDALPIVDAGAVLEARFNFRCVLHPGVYFMNAGVLAALGEGEDYVDRRIDTYMFRVMPSAERLATGFVDLLDTEPEVSVLG